MLCDRMEIDIWEVVDAAATKPYGFMRFEPGPGMGGHCLPVDPFYLSWKAREYDSPTEFIELAGEVNQRMPYFCVEKISDALNDHAKPIRGSRIAILGVSYKAGVGDMRESPGAQDHPAARGARRASSSTTTPTCPSCPSSGLRTEPLDEALAGADCAGDRDRAPGARHAARGRPSAARRRLPRRHARHRGRAPGPPVSATAPVHGRGRRPRLLGPEPRPQLRPPARRGAALDLRRRRRRSAHAGRRAVPVDAGDRPTSTSCSPTPSSTRSCRDARARRTASLALRAFEAGKHVFVEKPLAQSVAEAEDVVAAAREAGRVLMVGHLLEYHPGRREAQGDRRLGRARRPALHLLQPAEPRQAARGRERAVVARRARRVGGAAAGRRGADRGAGAMGESYMRDERRGRRVLLPALPVGAGRAPPPVVARPAQGAPLHRRRVEADGDVRRHGRPSAS